MPPILIRHRIWFLRIAAILVSFAMLALVEIGLRVAGYGGNTQLFVASTADDRYLQPNADVIRRYFANGMAPALSIDENYFLRDKPADGLRVFVQGGSTAAGFPFGSGASIASLLGYRLQQSFPQRPVEVINTAMSAVTSYVLLDFADEIIAEEPDAVVIYAGHNEFLGVLGIGSVYSGTGARPLKLLTLRLNRFRLYQLVRNLALQVRLLFDEPVETDATTLMAVIARNRQIALESEQYRQGIAQFRNNLTDLVARYAAAGIPVFIGTVASNLKDQPPFISNTLPAEIADETRSELALIADDQAKALSATDIGRLEQLAAEHTSAALNFAAGKAREQRGEFAAARADFVLARDHDLLRFRAPSDINAAIRQVADDTGSMLVDVEAAFDTAAPDGLLGHELILEHLHPTADGYFLLADAFYQAMADAAAPAAFERIVPTAAAREELWIFPAERYYARAAIAQLAADFPFSPTPRAPVLPPVRSTADALGRAWFDDDSSWLELAEASRDMAVDPLSLAVASQRIADSMPFRADLRERAAADWRAAGRPADAARYERR